MEAEIQPLSCMPGRALIHGAACLSLIHTRTLYGLGAALSSCLRPPRLLIDQHRPLTGRLETGLGSLPGCRLPVFKQVGPGFVSPSTACFNLTASRKASGINSMFLIFCSWGLPDQEEQPLPGQLIPKDFQPLPRVHFSCAKQPIQAHIPNTSSILTPWVTIPLPHRPRVPDN